MKGKFISTALCLALVPGALSIEAAGKSGSRTKKSGESRIWSLVGLGGRKDMGVREKVKFFAQTGIGLAVAYNTAKAFPTAKALLTEKVTGERNKWVNENMPSDISEDVRNFFLDPLVDLSFLDNDATKIKKSALFLDSVKKKYDSTAGVFDISKFSSGVDLKESELDEYIDVLNRIPFRSAAKYLFPGYTKGAEFLVCLSANESLSSCKKFENSRVAEKVSQDNIRAWNTIKDSFFEKGNDIAKYAADALPSMINMSSTNIVVKIAVNAISILFKAFTNDTNKNKYSTGNG